MNLNVFNGFYFLNEKNTQNGTKSLNICLLIDDELITCFE